jgi:hypothetical protein
MSEAPQPTPRNASIVKEKTQSLADRQIFTSERDERLDPFRVRITGLLIALVFVAMLMHTGLTFWVSYGTPEAARNVSAVFNIWVPVISGLASSAVTWFFTRGK